jgi:hypothetical protein
MARPWPTRLAERLLDPVIGKSLVVYCQRPAAATARPASHAKSDGAAAA